MRCVCRHCNQQPGACKCEASWGSCPATPVHRRPTYRTHSTTPSARGNEAPSCEILWVRIALALAGIRRPRPGGAARVFAGLPRGLADVAVPMRPSRSCCSGARRTGFSGSGRRSGRPRRQSRHRFRRLWPRHRPVRSVVELQPATARAAARAAGTTSLFSTGWSPFECKSSRQVSDDFGQRCCRLASTCLVVTAASGRCFSIDWGPTRHN